MTRLACKECESTSVDRDGDCMACGAPFDLIEEQWVGDDDDGCYIRVYEGSKGFDVEVVVDSETGSFVDTLATLDGFDTADKAMESGRGMAVEWCIVNEVSFDLCADPTCDGGESCETHQALNRH